MGKHSLHIGRLARVPGRYVLVECACKVKHMLHIHHLARVPGRYVLAEIRSLPAAPQSTSAKAQSQAPVGSAARQLSTAVFKAARFANAAASTGGEEGIKRSAQLNATVTSGSRSVATLGFRTLRRHAGRGPAVGPTSIVSAAARGVLSSILDWYTCFRPPAQIHTPVSTASPCGQVLQSWLTSTE
eukprot:scaffold7335_cov417-Prasinococcus_capsulatus_cf.AAC.14